MVMSVRRPGVKTEVPCKWCGSGTTNTASRKCARCSEMEFSIEHYPELARRMFEWVEAGPLGKIAIEQEWH